MVHRPIPELFRSTVPYSNLRPSRPAVGSNIDIVCPQNHSMLVWSTRTKPASWRSATLWEFGGIAGFIERGEVVTGTVGPPGRLPEACCRESGAVRKRVKYPVAVLGRSSAVMLSVRLRRLRLRWARGPLSAKFPTPAQRMRPDSSRLRFQTLRSGVGSGLTEEGTRT